jgi:DNA-binding NarL/FixJ family response regulator
MKGIEVTSAGNSQEAMRLAAEGGFNAAILDVTLGNENGIDLLDNLTRHHPALPVVMFTSLGNDPVLRADSLRRGARGVFSKTESIETLFQGIAKVIGENPRDN